MNWTRTRRVVPADDTTVDLTQTALDVAANRLLTATAKVDAALSRTKDRRQRDDLLDIRLSLTGRPS